ncbi:MAG: hypothetical protein HY775_13060 [Acidobacteria bacterium]|nr:hypothetical protein [Acidobacteriota bacterium]
MRALASLFALALLGGCSAGRAPASGPAQAGGGTTAASPTAAATRDADAPTPSRATTSTPVPTPSGSDRAAATPQPPAPGAYRYAQSGSTTIGKSFTTQAPPEGRLVVEAATRAGTGLRQRQTRETSGQHSEETTYLWLPGRVAIERIVVRYSSGGPAQEMRCEFARPPTALEIPLEVGASWSGSGDCQGARWSFSATVRRAERVEVASEPVATFVIEAQIGLRSNDMDQTSRSVTWFSPRYRLSVRSQNRSEGTYQGVETRSSLDSALADPRPS